MHGYHGWENPRFEDFEYESWLPEDDPLAYLGNGQTVAEKTDEGETTGYMDFEDESLVLNVPAVGEYPEPQDHPSLKALKGTGLVAGVPKKVVTNGVNGHAKSASTVTEVENVESKNLPLKATTVVAG